jgi:uncharacterized membrane protein YdjX (TVP38/TMEM64 family)
MKDAILDLFQEYQQFAIPISLFISILIAVSGIIPSVFITAANILFFGFWAGTAISFLGEAIGAAVAFYLYRLGFKKMTRDSLNKYPSIQKLVDSDGRQAVLLILSLRLLPFVPSGLVTFAAAIGRISLILFVVASSLGKIPALLIEAYSVNQVINFGWQGKLILSITALALLYWIIKKIRNNK